MSTTSSTLTSVLTALGGSTGIDVTATVDAILTADRAPETAWKNQQTQLTEQAAAIQTLESDSSTLSDALAALQASNGALGSVTATSSNSNLLSATAADGSATGTHQITINSLATSGAWYSAELSSTSSAPPAGSFGITAGGVTTTINVNGTDSLETLASSINGLSLGVTASVVTDSGGSRLALVSSTSGTAGDISISNDSTTTLTRSSTGADASLTVDGVPVTSASNTVSGAISGVTLNLLGASTGTQIGLTLSPDTSGISSAVSTFVSSYNSLISDLNTQFSFNTATSAGGPLQTDSAAQSFQSELLSAVNYSSGSGTYSSLSALGITANADGTLSLNSSTLTSAIQQNPSAVASFFQGSAYNGFSNSLTTTLDSFTDASQGAFTIDLQSINSEYNDLTDQINQLELYITAQQTTLTAKYNAADVAIQQLPQEIKQIQALLNPNQDSSSS